MIHLPVDEYIYMLCGADGSMNFSIFIALFRDYKQEWNYIFEAR